MTDCEECCCICLESFAARDTVELKCGHVFHTDCILRCLHTSHTTCALCRSTIHFQEDKRHAHPLTCVIMILIMVLCLWTVMLLVILILQTLCELLLFVFKIKVISKLLMA